MLDVWLVGSWSTSAPLSKSRQWWRAGVASLGRGRAALCSIYVDYLQDRSYEPIFPLATGVLSTKVYSRNPPATSTYDRRAFA